MDGVTAGRWNPLPLTKEWTEGYENQKSKDTRATDDRTEVNILFLGETGVGKSTWINAFNNYMTYETLAEAEQGPSVSIVSSMIKTNDEKGNSRILVYGIPDSNESHSNFGQSVTQMPRTYTFRDGKHVIRIFDTPGIGDTRGLEQDKINLSNILKHVANYDELHAICIFMKPDESRLTIMLDFCVRVLLRHLHSDAKKNIVFCFTHSRTTFFEGGHTLNMLTKFLAQDERRDVRIDLNKSTLYYFDNEAVKYLVSSQHGIKLDPSEREYGEESWETSAKESFRLIERALQIEPHQVRYTQSLNEVRRDIQLLSRPMAEVCCVIQRNIDSLEKKAAEPVDPSLKKKGLTSQLFLPMHVLTASRNRFPSVVCTNPKCNVPITTDVSRSMEHPAVCCPNCDLKFDSNILGSYTLRHCQTLQLFGGTCEKCGCIWSDHMLSTYTCKETLHLEPVETVITILKSSDKEASKKAIAAHREAISGRAAALQDELSALLMTTATFSSFLQRSAIFRERDGFLDYFNRVLIVKDSKVHDCGIPRHVADSNKLLEEYLKIRKKADDEASRDADVEGFPSELDSKEVHRLMLSLQLLPFAGKMLMDLISVAQQVGFENEITIPSAPERKAGTFRKMFKVLFGKRS